VSPSVDIEADARPSRLNTHGKAISSKASSQIMPNAVNDNRPSGGTAVTNVYAVFERDKVPPLGPNDVLAIVGDDIATRGSTHKHIKSVIQGI